MDRHLVVYIGVVVGCRLPRFAYHHIHCRWEWLTDCWKLGQILRQCIIVVPTYRMDLCFGRREAAKG